MLKGLVEVSHKASMKSCCDLSCYTDHPQFSKKKSSRTCLSPNPWIPWQPVFTEPPTHPRSGWWSCLGAEQRSRRRDKRSSAAALEAPGPFLWSEKQELESPWGSEMDSVVICWYPGSSPWYMVCEGAACESALASSGASWPVPCLCWGQPGTPLCGGFPCLKPTISFHKNSLQLETKH